MRRVEGEEESRAAMAGGGPMSRWLSNKGCVLCHRPTVKVIFLAQAALMAMQMDGKEGLCIAATTIGFIKKSIFLNGNLE